ncbi:MAG TPA: beta-N-acetylhexosaminidase [Clostridia bacterium]|nr:beta-N-acetylhexosaminidase [Clostridia bacterium]
MALIPLPSETTFVNGFFELTKKTALTRCEKLSFGGNLFARLFASKFGVEVESGDDLKYVFDQSLTEEEYVLTVKPDKILITAGGESGGIWATQTLRLLCNFDAEQNKIVIPCVEIKDKPRFGWRGVTFDVSRHFFDLNEIKRFLDLMSLMKLNVLHLHLCDDQGFRVEIEKYPILNKIASFRDGTLRRDGKNYIDNIRYGGYYTKNEIREMVGYATNLGIQIVPEIDLPGHTSAIVAAMPEISCRGEEISVRCEFGISTDILCAGNDKTYEVVKNILDEICKLFPSEYIHLGGDEAPKQNWKTCVKCQAKIKEQNLSDEEALQGYFFNYFAEYLAKKDKRVIGWNECLNETLSKDIVCQHWTPVTMGKNRLTVKHINNGRKAIVSDFLKTYFDYPYAMTPLKKVFDFDPFTTLKGINSENYKNVMGAECNIWTEWIPDRKKLDFNCFPRILAFAENAWRDEKTTYADFVNRLKQFYPLLYALGVGYAKNKEKPTQLFKAIGIIRKQFTKDAFCELKEQKDLEKNI